MAETTQLEPSFVQVTSAEKHSFKIRFFRKLLNQFELETGHIEIYFLVPLTKLKAYAISEVTGQGMLASCSVENGGEQKWKKSEESTLVHAVGMEQD